MRKEKSHVTETKDDRSYIKNAEVILKKKHCLNRYNFASNEQHCRKDKLLEAHR